MNALQGRFSGSRVRTILTAAALVAMAAGAPTALGRQDANDAQWTARAPGDAQSREISQAELDQALAGLALYPDALLSQALIACTYPIEVVQADRWAKANADLKGDALAAALETQSWDPSVKSLVNFPDVLASLSENIEWTARIGDAFVSDEKRVMDTIQALRARARAQGNLESTDNQRVIVERAPDAATTTIVIRSARPDVIYVPVYDPVVVYGGWWWPASPPVLYSAPRYWGPGVAVWWGSPRHYGPAWGYAWSSCNWWRSSIFIDISLNSHYNRFIDRDHWRRDGDRRFGWHDGRGEWRHDGEHRRGLAYHDDRSAREFGGVSRDDTERARENFRPQAEEGRKQIERGDILVAENSQGSSRRGAERGGEGGGMTGSRADERKGSETRASDDKTPSSAGGSTKGSGSRSGSVARGDEKSDDRKPDSPRASRTPSSSGTSKGSPQASEGGGTVQKPRQSAGTVTPGADDRTPTGSGKAGRGGSGRGSSGSSDSSPSSGSSGSSSSSPDRPVFSMPSGSRSSSSSSSSSSGSSGREPSPRATAPSSGSSGSSGSRDVSPRASSPSSGSSSSRGSSSRDAAPSRGSSGERGGSSSGSSGSGSSGSGSASGGSAPRGDSGAGSGGSASGSRSRDSRPSGSSGSDGRGASGSSGRGGSGRAGPGGN